MKIETIKKRLAIDRPMVSVTLRMPEDVVNDLKKIAPTKGFGGYQGLLRSYVGTGLRKDMEELEGSAIVQLVEKLREVGVPEETLNKAMSSSNCTIVKRVVGGRDKRIFVEQRTEGDYAVRRPNSERASDVLPTQAEAITRAKELTKGGSPVVERVRNTSGGKPDKWRKA
jgi:Uncharacterized protein conserved in bacteria (DUF2188)